MIEQIEQLEKRVDALARALGTAREQNETNSLENEELRARVKAYEKLQQQNQELETQVQRLESEIEAMAQREGQVRNRVMSIMERIDTLENESAAGAAHE